MDSIILMTIVIGDIAAIAMLFTFGYRLREAIRTLDENAQERHAQAMAQFALLSINQTREASKINTRVPVLGGTDGWKGVAFGNSGDSVIKPRKKARDMTEARQMAEAEDANPNLIREEIAEHRRWPLSSDEGVIKSRGTIYPGRHSA